MFKQMAIVRRGWEEGSGGLFSVDAVWGKSGLKRGADGGDVALTAHLGDESAFGFQGAVDTGKD